MTTAYVFGILYHGCNIRRVQCIQKDIYQNKFLYTTFRLRRIDIGK